MKRKATILSILLVLALSAAWLPSLAQSSPVEPMVEAGYYHTVSLKSDGTVWTWGHNSNGQLGDGGQYSRNQPVLVETMADVISVSGGAYYSLAVKEDGAVWAWGENSSGHLGDGTTTDRYSPVQVLNLSNVKAVSAGQMHSVAVKNDGTVWAWGDNRFGILGIGSAIDICPVPGQVQNLSDVKEVSAGIFAFSLAVKNDGTVWSWGYNSSGQLGDGTIETRSAPVQVPNLTDVKSVSAGQWHSLALKNDGTVWAWGNNNKGQLGDGSSVLRSLTPVQVQNLTNITAIAAGYEHSIALKNDGTVWIWGDNEYGQLGNGTTVDSNTPIQIQGLTGCIAVTGGLNHTAVVKSDGTVWTIGQNLVYQLGDGTSVSRNTPVQVVGEEGIGWLNLFASETIAQDIATAKAALTWDTIRGGNSAQNAVTVNLNLPSAGANGTAITWVSANPNIFNTGFVSRPALGVGNATGALTATISKGSKSDTVVFNLTVLEETTAQPNVITPTVVAGFSCNIALKSDGTVWCWGYNFNGQLGDGSKTYHRRPNKVPTLSGISRVEAFSSSFASGLDGVLWGWGYNNQGCLGVGLISECLSPVQITSLTDIKDISTLATHTLVVKSDGTVWGMGTNAAGQLGTGSSYSLTMYPVQAANLTGVTAVAAGMLHSLARRSDGTVWAFGNNASGEFGNGTSGQYAGSNLPLQASISDVEAIEAGSSFSVALKSDGTVWAWGSNTYGQLGDGSTTSRTLPVQAVGLTDIIAISASLDHVAALKSDGSVWTWGRNRYGQLGDGSTTGNPYPTKVQNLSGFYISVSAGDGYTVAVRSDGFVWAWGSNESYQLGDETLNNRYTPVQVHGETGVDWLNLFANDTSAQDVAADKVALTWDVIRGANVAQNAVTVNLAALPTAGANGTTITWNSTNPAVSNTGVVTRPVYGAGNAAGTLTATITKGSASDIVVFNLSVLEAPQTDAQAVAADKLNLTWPTIRGGNITPDAVTVNLAALPTAGANGTTITWSSANSAVSNTGVVTRPAQSAADATGALTATIAKGSASDTVVFNLTVLKESTVVTPAIGIKKAAVTVTAPAAGSASSATVAQDTALMGGAGAFAVGAAAWSPNDAVFQNSTPYTVTLTLTADSGYTFSGLLSSNVAVNGSKATIVSNDGATLTLKYTFPATAPVVIPDTAIKKAAVTVAAPAVGSAPSTSAVQDTALMGGAGAFTVALVTWSPNDAVFQNGVPYTVTVTLTADSGNTFSGLITANTAISGKKATIVSNDGATLILTYKFP